MRRRLELPRRAFLAAVAATAPTLLGCDRMLSLAARLAGDDLPASFDAPEGDEIDDMHHLVGRTSFGPRPGDIERARRMGAANFVAEQLDPAGIDDTACAMRTGAIDSAGLGADLLFELPPEQVEEEFARYVLLRAVYSRRQLLARMIELWGDHFHVAIGKSICRQLSPPDHQGVIGAHALGRFRDLLGASAASPSMLVYLDGRENKHERSGDRPNENYARELLELHTLGVHGGYTQADVMEAARCLTGWTVREEWAPGAVEFVSARHDDGEKRVLGQVVPAGGGRGDLDRLLDIVAEHPSTAQHIATKLCRAFVVDEPPRDLVASVAATFTATRGDIRAVLKSILASPEFMAAKGAKIKRPFRFVVSALRGLGADTHGRGALVDALGRMAHRPFAWPTPDGYPERGEAWLHTLLARFRFAFDLCHERIEGTRVDAHRLAAAVSSEDAQAGLVAHLIGRRPSSLEAREILEDQRPLRETLALALSSPAFQRF